MQHGGHQSHTEHGDHQHTEGCGHPSVSHDDHLDYMHEGHAHARHDDHWDEHEVKGPDGSNGGSTQAWTTGGQKLD